MMHIATNRNKRKTVIHITMYLPKVQLKNLQLHSKKTGIVLWLLHKCGN
jgi:hypothetical protein